MTPVDIDVEDRLYVRAFNLPPVYDLVFSQLSPRALVRFAQTCRVVYLAAANFKSRAFNVNRHFSRYFTNPIAFRSLQAKTNSLVSGSNALQFLDRTFYPEADFDLYVHPGHALEVATFLVETEGYRYAPHESQEQDWKIDIGDDWDPTQPRAIRSNDHVYPSEGINGVWTFEKTDCKNEVLKIQIIETSSCPVDAIIGFHSTCVMNFISSDAAYSLYPVATLEERSSLAMPSARSSASVVQKYVQRGWRFYFSPTPNHVLHPTKPPFMLEHTRWVGDKYTWVLPLDMTGVKARPPLSVATAPLLSDPALCNGWRVKLRPSFQVLGSLPIRRPYSYETHAYALQTTVFRYNYTIPDESMWFALRHWANEQERTSYVKLSKEEWVWFDPDLPGFLSALRNSES